MPQYNVQLSDGSTVLIESDSPPTEDEVLSAVSEYHIAKPAERAPIQEPRFKITPSPYEAADIESIGAGRGKALTGMEAGTEFTAHLPEALAAGGELIGKPIEAVTTALANVPRAIGEAVGLDVSDVDTIQDLPPTELPRVSGTGALAGVANAGIGAAEGFLQPKSIAMLPTMLLPGGAGKAVAGLFGAQQLAGLPLQAQAALKVIDDPDATSAQKAEAIAMPGISGLLGASMLHHAMPEGQVQALARLIDEAPLEAGAAFSTGLEMPGGRRIEPPAGMVTAKDLLANERPEPPAGIADIRGDVTLAPPESVRESAPSPAIETTETKGPENASSIGQAAEVHGDVLPQPGEGAGQVPTEERGGGVRPQGGEEVSPQKEALNYMEAARQVVDMTPDEFFKKTQNFNSRPDAFNNIELGRRATLEDVQELKALRDKATTRVREAREKFLKSQNMEDGNDLMRIASMVQYFNEAIAEHERLHPYDLAKAEAEAAAQGSSQETAKAAARQFLEKQKPASVAESIKADPNLSAEQKARMLAQGPKPTDVDLVNHLVGRAGQLAKRAPLTALEKSTLAKGMETARAIGDTGPLNRALTELENKYPKKKRVGRGMPGSAIFRRETELVGPDILDWISTNNRMLSRSEARRKWGRKKYEQNQSLWEGLPDDFDPIHRNMIFGGSSTPDTVAKAAHMENPRFSDDPVTFWKQVEQASRERLGARSGKAVGREANELQWRIEELENWTKATADKEKGDTELTTEDLAVGDFLQVEDERIEVVSRNEDGDLILKDGRTFGVQPLKEGQTIYVEKFEPAEAESPESSWDVGEPEPEPVKPAEVTKPAEPVTPEGMPVSQSIGGAVPAEFKEEGTAVSNMFAAIDRDRVKMGKKPMEAGAPRTWNQDEARALATMNRDPEWIGNLLAEVSASARTLLSWENAGLVFYRAKLVGEWHNALERINLAFEDGRQADLAEAKVTAGTLEDRIAALDKAVGRGGTGSEAGRSLQAQKMGLTDDLTLIEMRLERRAAKGGERLTETEESEIEKLHKEYSEKLATEQKLSAERETRIRQLETEAAVKEAQLNAEKELRLKDKLPAPVREAAERIAKQIRSNASAARERLKAKMARTSAGVDPTILADVAEIGAEYILDGLEKGAEWGNKMVEEVGEWIRPHLDQVYEAAVKIYKGIDAPPAVKKAVRRIATKEVDPEKIREGVRDKIRAKVEKGKDNELTPLAKRLAEAFWMSGIRELEPMVDAIHNELQIFIPGITRLEAMDALSGRGKFTLPNQDAVKKGVRELSAESRLLGHITQLLEGNKELPRTGPQRDKPTAKYRQLQQQLNELSKKLGITSSDPESMLASALQAAKTYTRNRIADLKQEISTRERIVKTKTPLAPDAELLTLRDELKKLQADHEQVFGKRQQTPEQKIAAASRLLERQIAAVETDLSDLAAGRPRTSKSLKPALETPELNEKRAYLAALREYRDSILDAQNPKLTPEQRLARTISSRIARQMADYMTRLARGDFATRPKRAPVKLDAAAEMNRAALLRLKEQWRVGNEKVRLQERAKWQKALEFVVKWERAFKLSSPIVFGKLGVAAISRVLTTAVEEIAGVPYSLAFSRLAERAPREGGFNANAFVKGLQAALQKGGQDAYQTLTKGGADIDVVYGGKVLDKEWASLLGQLHGMVKAPVKRFEYELALEKRLKAAASNGEDITDRLVLARHKAAALDDGYRSIFMQHSFAPDAFNNFVTMLEKWKRYQPAGEISARTLRFLLPIVRVPSNFVKEVGTGVFGLPSASARLMFHTIRGTLDTLEPEVADSIMRQFKKGSIGAGLMAIGYFNSQRIGGYDWRQKRHPEDPKVGGFQAPFLAGVGVGPFKIDEYGNLPRWATHAPWFELMQIGATIRRVQEEVVKGEERGITQGLWAAGFGLADEVPFVNQMLRMDKLSTWQGGQDYLGELAKSTLVPGVLEKIAQWQDVGVEKRNPKSIIEHVKMGIPYLRQQVPEKQPR